MLKFLEEYTLRVTQIFPTISIVDDNYVISTMQCILIMSRSILSKDEIFFGIQL